MYGLKVLIAIAAANALATKTSSLTSIDSKKGHKPRLLWHACNDKRRTGLDIYKQREEKGYRHTERTNVNICFSWKHLHCLNYIRVRDNDWNFTEHAVIGLVSETEIKRPNLSFSETVSHSLWDLWVRPLFWGLSTVFVKHFFAFVPSSVCRRIRTGLNDINEELSLKLFSA